MKAAKAEREALEEQNEQLRLENAELRKERRLLLGVISDFQLGRELEAAQAQTEREDEEDDGN